MVKYVSYPRSDHVQNISAESKYFVTFFKIRYQYAHRILQHMSTGQHILVWSSLLPSAYMQQVTTFTILKEININE